MHYSEVMIKIPLWEYDNLRRLEGMMNAAKNYMESADYPYIEHLCCILGIEHHLVTDRICPLDPLPKTGDQDG